MGIRQDSQGAGSRGRRIYGSKASAAVSHTAVEGGQYGLRVREQLRSRLERELHESGG